MIDVRVVMCLALLEFGVCAASAASLDDGQRIIVPI